MGEYNSDWNNQGLKGYGLSGTGCTPSDESNLNCTPLKALCKNLHCKTALLPTFGGQPPTGGLSGIKDLIGTCNWDGESFISWNITDPNAQEGSGGGNYCPGHSASGGNTDSGGAITGRPCGTKDKGTCLEGNTSDCNNPGTSHYSKTCDWYAFCMP